MVNLPSFLPFAKLRGSYAYVGNDTAPYMLDLTYSISAGGGQGYAWKGTTLPADAMMRRLKFTDTEYNTNAAAVEAAKGLLNGPDNGATRLWWNPAK